MQPLFRRRCYDFRAKVELGAVRVVQPANGTDMLVARIHDDPDGGLCVERGQPRDEFVEVTVGAPLELVLDHDGLALAIGFIMGGRLIEVGFHLLPMSRRFRVMGHHR